MSDQSKILALFDLANQTLSKLNEPLQNGAKTTKAKSCILIDDG